MRHYFSISSAALLGMMSFGAVQASGFALIEQSASGQGLSYAGAAVSTEDASVMWFNPAGMTSIQSNQIIGALHGIAPKAPFNDEGSYFKNTDGSTSPLFGSGDDGANNAIVPNVYWKTKFGEFDFGLGVNVPFGSTVEYDQNWVGRYHAVYTKTQTLNINPNIARKLGDNLSVGFGVNAQYIDVTLTQKIDFGAQGNVPQGMDGYADLNANGWGFGYNFGLIYDFENKGKLGFAYRSQVEHNPTGQADFTLPTGVSHASYADTAIEASMALPATASLSYEYPYSQKTNILADATWTGWSVFDELRIEFENPQKTDSVQPEDWTDSMRYSLGVTHQYNADWMIRAGVALDETPIKNKYLRTPRISDSTRTWFSAGFGYAISPDLNLDVGYTKILGGKPEIEATDADTGQHVLKGHFDIDIDILSAQLVWNY